MFGKHLARSFQYFIHRISTFSLLVARCVLNIMKACLNVQNVISTKLKWGLKGFRKSNNHENAEVYMNISDLKI